MAIFLIGATLNGTDHSRNFIQGGYAKVHYSSAHTPEKDNIKQVQVGDYIVIKSMNGTGSTKISIKALGIVTNVVPGKIYHFTVNWYHIYNNPKQVDSKGNFSRISQPYVINKNNGRWLIDILNLDN